MGPSESRKEKGTRTYHQLLTEISVVDIPAFPELLRMTRVSCRVATRALSLRFCRENFNSGDFFLAIFSPVASQVRGWLHVRFSSRAGDATKFEKIASPARAKNRSCGRGFKVPMKRKLSLGGYKIYLFKHAISKFEIAGVKIADCVSAQS